MPRSEAFNRLYKSMEKQYLYKDVPVQYRKRYGKRYDKKDVKSFAIATARKLGVKY